MVTISVIALFNSSHQNRKAMADVERSKFVHVSTIILWRHVPIPNIVFQLVQLPVLQMFFILYEPRYERLKTTLHCTPFSKRENKQILVNATVSRASHLKNKNNMYLCVTHWAKFEPWRHCMSTVTVSVYYSSQQFSLVIRSISWTTFR